MSRLPRRICNRFAKTAHVEQQEQQDDVAAEGSHMSTQRPTNRPPLEVLYPSPNSIVSNEIEVDIVAVHGLGSNVDWSWAWQDKKGHRPPVHWLKDANMLPRVVPHARIIAYNYESRWHADAPKTRLELCGEELVKSLHNFRTDALERPIIFIAHSLGGLVVLHGLLYADRTEELKYLPAFTVGFAPLGTPFRGTKMQNLAKILAWLMIPVGSHNGIITELEQDNKHLADDVHKFGELRDRLHIPTICFVELRDSGYGKKIGLPCLARGIVVKEESAHIPGWGREPLYTDHFKLNKFEGPNDRSFLTVSRELCKMCANWRRVIGRRNQATRDRNFMVPFGRNRDFVGRETILKQLLERVPPSVNKDDCQRTAVEGLGGIGKTQVALETAYKVRDAYPDCSIFWVPAIDLTSFENAYREIGRLLQVPNINDDKGDKMLVKRALEHARAGSWLLIIDNADDINMLFQDAKLANYLPFSRQGSILFTTRNHQVAVKLKIPQRNIVTVPEMDDAEATRLLRINLKESQIGDTESTERLLHFLTNLPLAIKQASAYMRLNENVTISQYLESCKSSNADMIQLLSEQFEDGHRYDHHAQKQNPIATTWLISFEHLSQQNPQAADYLKFICFLAEKNIPLSLLPVTSNIERDKAIGLLIAYAFILKRDTPDSFDIHRLVRLVTRRWLQEKGEWGERATNAFQRLAQEYPFPNHENKKTWTGYLPHGQAVLDIEDAIHTEKDTDLLFNIAESYFKLGKYHEAERLFRQTLGLREGTLGKNHPHTLAGMNNLAAVLEKQGKYKESEAMVRQTLELRKRVLGREHSDTLTSMSNLALVLERQRKYKESEAMVRQTLELRKRVLGREHPGTLISMNNLAMVLEKQEKHKEAEAMDRQTLELQKRVLGREHPDTLISMNNLAIVLAKQEKHKEAEAMDRQTLELQKRVLGREHPDTLTSMNNLALILERQKKYKESEAMHRQELELSKEVRGKKHPNTLTSMDNLAFVLGEQKKYEEAEAIYQQTLELKKEVLGREHPDTLTSIDHLASLLDSQGKYKEAEGIRKLGNECD